jgi:cell division protein FtsB
MKTARRNFYAQALMAAVVLIGLYFMWSFAKEVVQAQQLANQVELRRQENDHLRAEKRELEREKQYYESDEYVRLRARTDLNLRSPDEVVVYPVLTPGAVTSSAPADGAPTSAAPAPPGAAVAAAASPARTWERWLDLFTNPAH